MKFLGKWVFFIMAAIITGCGQSVTILFPSDGAELDNPVHLVASNFVAWYDGDKRLGEGDLWSGFLEEGYHEIRAVGSDGADRLRLYVREFFPLMEIITLLPTYELPKAPGGEYVRIWGRAIEETGALNASNLKDVLLDSHSKNGGLSELTALGPDRLTLAELVHQRTVDLLKNGRASACGLGCTRAFPAIRPTSHDVFEERTFKVINLSGAGYTEVTAKLIYQGQNTLAYLENEAFAGVTGTREKATSVASVFDTHVHRRVESAYGNYSDVDGNGKVILLFTKQLNDSNLAIGFFYPGDLFEASDDLPESNEAEILYLGVPDEQDINFSQDSLVSTACHELQHLVNFSHITLPFAYNPNPPISPVWLNEGLSHLAEDLCGYNSRGGNLAFVARFLERPWVVSLTSIGIDGRGDTIERRGAAYLFLRYALEQAGGVSFNPNGELKGEGLRFTRSLMDPDAMTLDAIADRAIAERNGSKLLWRWWWTLVAANLGQKGIAVTEHYPWATYKRQAEDPVTGDVFGIDLFMGDFRWGNILFSLKGVAFSNDCSRLTLPTYAFCAEMASSPFPTKWDTEYSFQVMRTQ